MVPDTDNPADVPAQELYVVVRKAVEDAMLSVIETLVLLGMAAILVWFGVFVTVASMGTNPVQAVGGVVVILVGLYFVVNSLGWFSLSRLLG